MEAEGGNPAARVVQPEPGSPLARLLADPYRFDFFQAVRLLAKAAGGGEATDPRVRFRAAPGLGFPASPIADVSAGRPDAEGRPTYEVVAAFLGLTGPSGVLPPHYTETLLRLRAARSPLSDWLDLFNHRLLELFFDAWAKYRPDVTAERAAARLPPHDDEYATALLSLIGLGSPALRGRVRPRPADRSLVSYGGFLARHPRTAAGLEAVLSGHLGRPVRVVQFVGRWLPLSPASQSRLGRSAGNATLGRTAVVGRRVWNVGAVRVRVGPLTEEGFTSLLPPPEAGSAAPFDELVRLVRFYLGPEFDFDVQLVPKAAEVPAAFLGSAPGSGSRLGCNSWLRGARFTTDPEDACFEGRERNS